jgi:tRNA-(ms[2]io[6]A)-hydroxylase
MNPVLPAILAAPTDPAWFAAATRHIDDLLIDHANCEKKAASTALALMFAYPEDFELAGRMSRLAREELRHFELVQKKLVELEIPFRRMTPSRYAEGMRRGLSRDEPQRRRDLLLCSALIEARSHERFLGLVERLPAPLGEFYASLADAEARHAGLYLRLASRAAGAVDRRLAELADTEAELATAPDREFRFHSGTPA